VPTNAASVESLTGLTGQATAAVKLSVLRELAFIPAVNVIDEDSPAPDKHGYQRESSSRRFPQIGKHYLAGGRITNIIVNVRVSEDDRDEFIKMLKAGDVPAIHEVYTPRVFAVIDGQHRLGGLKWAQDEDANFDPQIPLTLFFGMTYEDEAIEFDTINTKQKNIPRPLVEFTKATITERGSDTYEQKIRGIAMSLASDEDSPWYERINFTGARSTGIRKTTFEGLRRSLTEMYPREFLGRIEQLELDPQELAKTYWSQVVKASKPAWVGMPDEDGEPVTYRLTDLVGVATVSRLGKDVLTSAIEHSDDTPIDETISEMAARFVDVDWRKGGENDLMAGRAGWAGVKALYEALYPVITAPRMEPAKRRGRPPKVRDEEEAAG
jgi:DGQHR domain-containing protein